MIIRNRNTSLASGLLAHWKFDGDSSDSIRTSTLTDGLVSFYSMDGDSSDYWIYGNDGTDTLITYSSGNGKVGSGAGYTTSSTITAPCARLENSTQASFSFWVESADYLFPIFLLKTSTFDIRYDGTYQYGVQMRVYNSGATDFGGARNSTGTMTPGGTWSHVVITYDGSLSNANRIKIYIDGVSQTVATFGAIDIPTTLNGIVSDVIIGSNLTGSMDEVGLWERTLTQAEVTQLYNRGNGQSALGASSFDGVDSGVTYGAGKFGSAMVGNGSSAYTTCGDIPALAGSSQMSISLWFNVRALKGDSQPHTLINKWYYTDGTRAGFQVETAGSDEIFMFLADGVNDPGNNYVVSSGVNWSYGQWKHLVIVFDGTQVGNSNRLKMYADGVQVSLSFTGTIPATLSSSTQPVTFGYFPTNTPAVERWLDGKIDEVGIWNRTLTDAERALLLTTPYPYPRMTNTTNFFQNLVGYWPLDGTAKDVKGNDGQETNVEYIDGKVKQSAYFNGTSAYIYVPDTANYNIGSNDFAIQAWVKRDALGARHCVLAQVNSAGGDASLSINFEIDASNYVSLNLYDTVGPGIQFKTSDVLVDDTLWHHIVITRVGDSLNFYKDGVLGDALSMANVSINNSAFNFAIGKAGEFNGLYFNGLIDEVAFWNGRGLVASEVLRLYNNGDGMRLVPHSDMIDEGLVSFYKMNGDSSDFVGGYDGTDTSVSYVTGFNGDCASFNGTTSNIVVGDESTYSYMQNTGNFTIAFWYKVVATGVLEYFMGNTPTSAEKGFFIAKNSDGSLFFVFVNGDSNPDSLINITVSSVFTDTEWHHLAITSDKAANACSVYKDGTFLYSEGVGTLSTGNSTRTLKIGQIQNTGTNFYNGLLDDLGFWNRPLSQNEIYRLCKRRESILNGEDTDTAYLAFSLRRMDAYYDGPAIRVRRSSDDAELDIEFKADGDLDLDAMTEFVGASTGYVTTWYDQSGNSRHATAIAANQPFIIFAGALVVGANGKPAVYHVGSNVQLTFGAPAIGTEYTLVGVVEFASYNTSNGVEWLGGGTNMYGIYLFPNGTQVAHGSNGNFWTRTVDTDLSTTYRIVIVRDDTSVNISLNESYGAATPFNGANPTFSLTGLSGENATYNLNGYLQETIVWNSTKSASVRLAIENNLEKYYA